MAKKYFYNKAFNIDVIFGEMKILTTYSLSILMLELNHEFDHIKSNPSLDRPPKQKAQTFIQTKNIVIFLAALQQHNCYIYQVNFSFGLLILSRFSVYFYLIFKYKFVYSYILVLDTHCTVVNNNAVTFDTAITITIVIYITIVIAFAITIIIDITIYIDIGIDIVIYTAVQW